MSIFRFFDLYYGLGVNYAGLFFKFTLYLYQLPSIKKEEMLLSSSSVTKFNLRSNNTCNRIDSTVMCRNRCSCVISS